jgi:antitoxin MazE
MKVSLVQVGNSRGVRLPKAVLEQCDFANDAELTVEEGRIVLTPIKAPRGDWGAAFAAAPALELSEDEQDWLDAPLADNES